MEEMNEQELSFARACIALLKGVVDRQKDEGLWQDILKNRDGLKEYLAKIGLEIFCEELDGYAYLRQMDVDGVPRLVQRRPVGYGLSMLLVFLRKRLGEFDSSNGDQKLIVSTLEMRRGLEVFLPVATNEELFIKQVEKHIQKAVDMGVLRKIGEEGEYEVRPIIRSFIDAEWLNAFDKRLEEYKEYGAQLVVAEGEEAEDGLIHDE
ncbi:MAG: DUF4194 domain-containing protein [Selenomonadaceae bacterium]|nr:DUF4194 domain-containing protein [Selenomonadaceae bacterium]